MGEIVNSKTTFGVGVYFCVHDIFVDQGQQLISEERCSGVDKCNSLGLVDVCHNLVRVHTTTTFRAGNSANLNKRIYQAKVDHFFYSENKLLGQRENTIENLELLHWLLWLDTHQNLILSELPLEKLLIGQDKGHARLSGNVD